MIDNNLLPNDPQAESSVLSCILLENEIASTCYELLKPNDFYNQSNKEVFSAMMELFSENTAIDIVTLKSALEKRGTFEQIGGIEFLSSLIRLEFTTVNISNYIKIVAEKSVLRKLAIAANEILNKALESKEPSEIILDYAEKSIFEISQNRNSSEFSHIHDVLVSAIDNIEKAYLSTSKVTGLPTGFYDFDNKTSGLQSSDLVLIAARPSMGKTAFALNIAQNVSVNGGKTVAVFSLEMSKEQLVKRLISSQAKIDAQNIRAGELDDNDWDKLIECIEPLSKAKMYIDDTAGITVTELRTKCRRLKLEKGLDLIVIDYLQLMSSSKKSNSRQEEISEISRSLKSVARELNVPVIALSQLSRAVETRADHTPMLSDLRESGAIEQDADVVVFLYRDEYYNPETEKRGQAEVIIAKQRNGPTGVVDLVWLSQFTKFENMEHGKF